MWRAGLISLAALACALPVFAEVQMQSVEWRTSVNKSEGQLPQFHTARLATADTEQATQAPEQQVARPPAPLSRWTSLGCFRNGAAEDIEEQTGVIRMNLHNSSSTGGVVMVPRDPVNCTIACAYEGYSVAAMRSEACFCLQNRSSLDAVNVIYCGLPCTASYFSSTAKFCGGVGQHYSVYQEYDFSHSTAQGCYDPFRYIWYQSVAVEALNKSATNLELQPGFQWYIHAANISTGEPLFPYQHEVENMLFGLHYDLDGSRIVGYRAPYWRGKNPADLWKPKMQIWEVNSMQNWNIRWSMQQFVPTTFTYAAEEYLLSTGVTALDSIYDIYYMTVPGIMSDDGTHFLTRVYALELDTQGAMLHAHDLDEQVAELEVNDDTHELFGILHVRGSGENNGVGHFYVKLGEATMDIKWPENPFESIETTLGFYWTFDSDFREATVNLPVFFGEDNITQKYFQIGGGAIDVMENTSYLVIKDRPDSAAPWIIKDVNFEANDTELSVVDPLAPVPGPEVNALWIFNLHPITTWFSPEVWHVRFHMDGHIVYVRFENQTLGGIQPFDVNGDTLPDIVDWSLWRTGLRNCSEMFDATTTKRLRDMPYTQCEFEENNTLIIRLKENVSTLNPGESITLRNDTIYSYYAELQCWSFSAFGSYVIALPDPLYPPVPQVFSMTGGSAGMDFSVYPKDEVPLCYTSGIDATNSYYHGGLPVYTWILIAQQCVYTDSFGYTTGFFPNQTMTKALREKLGVASRGSSQYPSGHSRVDFTILDLEPGCTFSVRMTLLGRWGLSSVTDFQLFKMPPPPVLGWLPSCDYHCNAATCEPPSKCIDGVCVCAEDRYGLFCTGICPMCSPYKSFGCDDGQDGSGTCICRIGWVGDYCDQKVEWKATDWSPCLPCGAAVGTQERILECVNVVTQQVVNETNCEATSAGATQNCKPPLCPCSVPPEIENADNDAIAQACPITLSGAACAVICLPGFIAVGEFRCYAESFIELPRCLPAGAPMVTLPGVSMRLRIGGISTSMSPNAYLDEIGPSLKRSIAKMLSESLGFTLSPEYVTLRIIPLTGDVIVGGGSAGGNSATDSDTAGVVPGGRRLQVKNYEIVATIAFPNIEALDQGEALLSTFQSDPSPLRDGFKAEYLSTCNATATCVSLPPDDFWEADAPARTQVYTVQSVAVIASTTTPEPGSPEALALAANRSGGSAGSAGSAGTSTSSGDSVGESNAFVMGVVMGVSIGFAMMMCCCVGGLLLVIYKMRKRSKVVPELLAELAGPVMVEEEQNLPARVSALEPAENTRILDMFGKPLSGRVRRDWPGGGHYDGYIWEGLREGEGRMEWSNGKIYAGQWLRGKPHGHGLLTSPGEKDWTYNGQFKNGLRDGTGRCESLSRGKWYEGEWRGNLKQGVGESGALPHAPGGAPSSGPDARPTAHLWTMENGEPNEHLSHSPVAPEPGNVIKFSMEVTQEDLDRIEGPDYKPGGDLAPAHTDIQRIAVLWGMGFGEPDDWLPGRSGALLLTRILDDGALARWNMWQHRDFGTSATVVLPNALIWKVNDMEADLDRMGDELQTYGGRRSITLTVCNPASSRCPRPRPHRAVRLPPMPASRAMLGSRGLMQPPRPPEGLRPPSASDPNSPEVVDLRSAAQMQMPSAVGLLNLPPPPPLLPPRPPLGREGSPPRSDNGELNLPPLPKAVPFSYRRAANIQRNNALEQPMGRDDALGPWSLARTSSPRPPQAPGGI